MSSDGNFRMVKFKSSSPSYYADKIAQGDTGMIEQTALVVSVESGQAWVIPQQGGAEASGCAACAGKSSCSSSSPFAFLHREPQKMRVLNPVYARPGDSVVVGVQGQALVIYSLLAYLLPLVGLILAAIIGQAAFAWLGVGAEPGSILGGVAGLLGGLRLANFVVSCSFRSSVSQPVILRLARQPAYTQILPLA